MSRWGIALVVMLVANTTKAQEPEKVATPSDALGWALSDLATLPPEMRPFVRYVWLPPWAYPSWHGAMSFTVNTAANRSSTLVHPVILANGYLMRWDLRTLVDDTDKDLKDLVEVWDSLASDEPYFHIAETNKRTGPNVAIVAPHIATEHAKLMADMNLSPALVYRADWLASRMLMTINGGKYYEFRGITKSKDPRLSDQQYFLKQFGGYEAESQRLNADERVGIRESGITKFPRRVDGFRGLGGKSGTGQIFITHDMSKNDTSVEAHPLYNLLTFKDFAREIILEANNGLHVFALFNGKGELQRFVPQEVVPTDTTAPPPGEPVNGAISCIACHGKNDGLQDAPNDIAVRLSGKIDAFDDLSSSKDQIATVKRLAALYAGDFTRRITQGRDDYAWAVFAATGGMQVGEVSEATAVIVRGHTYDMVSPQQALWEAGWYLPKDKAQAFIESRIAPYQPNAAGLVQEDGTIADLRSGAEVQRFDYDRVFADFISRMKEPAK